MKPIGWAGLAGFTAIALGAFGAHGLRGHLPETSMTAYETAVLYHLVHAAVLAALALHQVNATPAMRLAFKLFGAGVLLFSGSLYAMALGSMPSLGWITPLGGLCLLAGWGALFIGGFRRR